jgi:hypothetical protein
MEKTDLLRVRVTSKLKTDFEAVCATFGNKAPADMLREIVADFVQSNIGRLGDRVVVHISRPEGYDFGAWRVFIKLRNPEDATWNGSSVPFALPKFEKRRLASDDEYKAVVGVPNKDHFVDYEMGGVFNGGEWRGHLYSNGIEETQNPTTINRVQTGLVEYITAHLDKFK